MIVVALAKQVAGQIIKVGALLDDYLAACLLVVESVLSVSSNHLSGRSRSRSARCRPGTPPL